MTIVHVHSVAGLVSARGDARTLVVGQSFADMVGGVPATPMPAQDSAAGFAATGVFGTQRTVGTERPDIRHGSAQTAVKPSQEHTSPEALRPVAINKAIESSSVPMDPAMASRPSIFGLFHPIDPVLQDAPMSFHEEPVPSEDFDCSDGIELNSASHLEPEPCVHYPHSRKRISVLLDDEINVSMIASGDQLSTTERTSLKQEIDALARQFGIKFASASLNGIALTSLGNSLAGD